MQALLDVILPVFLVVALGYVLTWRKIFPLAAVDGLMRYAQGVAVPCLLFMAIARLDLQASVNAGLLISFYVAATLCFVMGTLAARHLIRRSWEDSVAIGFCCLFSNSVLLGLPINARAFGEASLAGAYTIIAFHATFCYGLGITVMETVRHAGAPLGSMVRSVLKAMFNNALVLAIIAGFAVNLSGLNLPLTLADGLDLIAVSALPAALFALGGVLVQYRPEGDGKAIALVCLMALIVHPALTWSFGTLQQVPLDLFRAGVVTAAMAPGFNAYVFANMYGTAKRVAATSVLMSTGLSVGTVWLWLLILS